MENIFWRKSIWCTFCGFLSKRIQACLCFFFGRTRSVRLHIDEKWFAGNPSSPRHAMDHEAGAQAPWAERSYRRGSQVSRSWKRTSLHTDEGRQLCEELAQEEHQDLQKKALRRKMENPVFDHFLGSIVLSICRCLSPFPASCANFSLSVVYPSLLSE